MSKVYTFGYGGCGAASLLAWCEANGAVLLDIRFADQSMRPEWRGCSLVRQFGARYRHVRELGNINYRNGGDIELFDWLAGKAIVRDEIANRNVVLMCQCRELIGCHRNTIAQKLRDIGIESEELIIPDDAPGGGMKYISLWNPWAFLYATGEKRNETRGWATGVRGVVAIHAAAKKDRASIANCFEQPFRECLVRNGITSPIEMPFGAIIGVVNITGCTKITAANAPGGNEREFGDYAPGRYMHHGEGAILLREPIPYKASQGKYLTLPPEIAYAVTEQLARRDGEGV